MNSGRSDASTSTDDVQSRPLCLFYFTHPFGVLSPEPPTLAPAPPHIARAFVNMEPVAPFVWGSPASDASYNTATSSDPAPLLSVARARRCTLELGPRRDSLSSSLFSNDAWFGSTSSCRSGDYPRRLVPYNKILPPLRLPSPRDSSNLESSDDFWPKKCLNPEKFSLPPISMPEGGVRRVRVVRGRRCAEDGAFAGAGAGAGADSARSARRRRLGVRKPRRVPPRQADLRRAIASLMRRALGGGGCRGHVSPALREALRTVREAWPEPRLLLHSRILSGTCVDCVTEAPPATSPSAAPRSPPGMAEPAPRTGASPGLLRRRYSVPETIMRKYRLAQLRSDSDEDSAPHSHRSATSASASACSAAHRLVRRDRELMRKSALLRRLWGRNDCRGCCCCESRSLDASRSELRARASPQGWASPKRQRLDSARDSRGSDEMLRAAMRNSYDRAEESRSDRTRADLSDSTYRSHRHERDSYLDTSTDAFVDGDHSKPYDGGGREEFVPYAERRVSESPTIELKSTTAEETGSGGETSPAFGRGAYADDHSSSASRAGSADAHIDGRVSERAACPDNADDNVLLYDRPLRIEPPSYEVLEIVVSETLNYDSTATDPDSSSRQLAPRPLHLSHKNAQNINIDEYVSNILVESLNSLSDQLECMNASIGSDRKMSIVEKEIKVKLQNTGVNTIVHLSPTSNNQIIFGNEELCNVGVELDRCNNPSEPLSIRDESHSVELNNNADEPRCSCAALQQDQVNRAVLQQIQKLFHDELHSRPPDAPPSLLPEMIAHVESSNVDAFLDGHEAALEAERRAVLGGVGAANYLSDADDNPVVPRFSAYPHTDSMEVNTSSSEDADLGGSGCTSLVDSLDDPNSPRNVSLRRGRRDLVRSAVDVLDLLPESARDPPRDKGESFFIKIKGDECECAKENVNVADRMPEKIRQRLHRRNRKREQRMECARRSRGKSARDAERARRAQHAQHARRAERDCAAILDAVLDDVIAKVAQEEYKCLRLSRRPAKNDAADRKDSESTDDWSSRRSTRSDGVRGTPPRPERERGERRHVRGKLSLLTRPPLARDERAAKRIYQKSEIHDGNKCIEILEILEYVNGSQSSPETATSDENQNHSSKNKKSRIPIPITERNQRSLGDHGVKGAPRRGSLDHDGDAGESLADLLARALGSPQRSPPERPERPEPEPARRSRSNSLRFKRVFDIIPEERSSLSLESGAEELGHTRRASAPDIVDQLRESPDAECDAAPPVARTARVPGPRPDPLKHRLATEAVDPARNRDTRSAATSPMSEAENKRALRSKNQMTMTSPSSRSAATSPLRHGAGSVAGGGTRRWARADSHDEGSKAKVTVPDRSARPPRPAPRRPRRPPDSTSPPDAARSSDAAAQGDGRDSRTFSRDAREASVKLPEFKGGGGSGAGSSSDSSESGSLLCSLAPKWLAPRTRRPRRSAPPPAPAPPVPPPVPTDASAPGGWSVTVAGSCRAALPADVEMRLRFPHERDADKPCQDCTCRHCAACSCGARGGRARPRGELPPAPLHHHLTRTDSSKLTLTMKKEALDSSILASKSSKKSSEQLPGVETYRASRSKLKSSVKTRRGYSLHCWLPENEAAPIRTNDGLSVLGCAIIPELKPRVPTMSERDLTRLYTPRHYLRS